MFRILVIESDQPSRLMYKAELEYRGYRVSCASDTYEALESESVGNPDLILFSIEQPWQNCLDTLEIIRMSEPDLPVILLPGKDTPFDVLERAGMFSSSILQSPFLMSELDRTLRNFLPVKLG